MNIQLYSVGDLIRLPVGSSKRARLGLVTRVRRRPGAGQVKSYVLLMSGGNEYEMDVGSWDEAHSSLVQKM